MGDKKLAVAGLDWLEQLGIPPEVLASTRAEVEAQTQSVAGPPARQPKAIKVSPSKLLLEPGESAQLAAERIYASGPGDPLSGEHGEVIWKSSTVFFTVDNTGLVTAAGLSGTPKDTLIIATDPNNRLRGYCTAILAVALPTALRIEPARLQLGADETARLKAIRLFPGGKRTEDASSKVTWTSSQSVVTVKAGGFVTAYGITGEMEVVITAADPDAPLTATATIVVSASHDVTLDITPSTVELAPGGSLQYKAERVGKAGRQDVTEAVDWNSSSKLLTIDARGNAVADAKAVQSETVDITATDREADLTTKVIAFINVPSRVVETYPTPFGRVAFFEGYEGLVKPRLEWAARSFEMAEQREDQLDRLYEAFMQAKKKIGPSLQNAAADVRRSGSPIAGEAAQNTKHDDFRDADLRDAIAALDQDIEDSRARVRQAAGAMLRASESIHLHELQAEAKKFDEDLDLASKSGQAIASLIDPTAGLSTKVAKIQDVVVLLGKRFLNPHSDDAKKMAKDLDDKTLRAAADQLADAHDSAARWADLRIKQFNKQLENLNHALEHWKKVERVYDTTSKQNGGFRFEKAEKILDAGRDATKAADETGEWAALAEAAARDVLEDDPKPSVWLAAPEKDADTLRTLLGEASAKKQRADERTREIAAALETIDALVQEGRNALLEPEAGEP